MKLAEALILRSDLQKRFNELKNRIINNVMIQEGTEPVEHPKDLVPEAVITSNELCQLIKAINFTNGVTKLENGMTLMEAITERDRLKTLHELYLSVANAATSNTSRYSLSEIRNVSTINAVDFRQDADALAKAFRELDTKIQATNWNTDLIN